MSSTDDTSRAHADTVDAWRKMGADEERLVEIETSLSQAPENALVGRVSRVDRGRFQLLTNDGLVPVSTTGVSPVGVGDWCLIIDTEAANGPSSSFGLHQVLARRSALVRQSSGSRTEVQALAANIDTVMVVVPLDRPISQRQVERFLALAWDSGATPVLVLTKVDLVDEELVVTSLADVKAVSGDLPVVIASVVTGAGMNELASYITLGTTVALLGTSGSGKSSMVNALMGADVVQTGAVRETDSKGRHTTTWREMLVVPTGGTLIDTPGLRELGMWIADEGIGAAFSEITALAEQCRFNDCAHTTEPGCAVLAAISSGELEADRLASYRKLLGEAAYAARKNDHRLAKEEQKIWKHRSAEGRGRARP
jgi:ribosome biogenesis GTPase / thiamine phosphate phosphatase